MSIVDLKRNISQDKISFYLENPKNNYNFPQYDVLTTYTNIPIYIYNEEDSFFETVKNRRKAIEYDIDRVSARNAKKGDKSPYKTSELRHIILSYNMGKATGSKKDLVSTILSFHKSRT